MLSRVGLGWYMFSTGWDKVVGELNTGFGTFLASRVFQPRGEFLPGPLAALFGYSWPWLETLSGLLVVLGLFTRASALLMAALLAAISFALVLTGEYFPRHHTQAMLPMALLIWALGPGSYSLDGIMRGRRS
jgi:uncharacterized membrane protein YphA (DoxX/SURF4 family)